MFLGRLGSESVNVFRTFGMCADKSASVLTTVLLACVRTYHHWYFWHEYGHITIGHYQILFSCAPGISEKKATGMVI